MLYVASHFFENFKMEIKMSFYGIEEIDEFVVEWYNRRYRPSIDKEEEETSHEVGYDMPVTYRDYAPSIIRQIPKGIIEVKPNGVLIKEKGKCKAYNMYTLLKLREMIPNTERYPSMGGMKYTSCCYVCAGIELHMFEHLFNQWENLPMKYDEFGQLI